MQGSGTMLTASKGSASWQTDLGVFSPTVQTHGGELRKDLPGHLWNNMVCGFLLQSCCTTSTFCNWVRTNDFGRRPRSYI